MKRTRRMHRALVMFKDPIATPRRDRVIAEPTCQIAVHPS